MLTLGIDKDNYILVRIMISCWVAKTGFWADGDGDGFIITDLIVRFLLFSHGVVDLANVVNCCSRLYSFDVTFGCLAGQYEL